MTKEELKLLDELKEHCLKQGMYKDPYAMKKYKMFEMMELKIYELEKEIKHLKDLQNNMDKQYMELEDRNNKAIDNIKSYCTEFGELVHYGDSLNPVELVNILKGVEND